MSTSRLRPHPRFNEIREAFRKHPEWFKAWSGTLFRFQTVKYSGPEDILSGTGARRHGGRWNPPGLTALYGSTTDTTALEECKAHDRYYGVITREPRILVAIEARLTHMLDLTDTAIRRKLGFTFKEAASEDWRKLMAANRESLTQALGRAAAICGASGLIANSAAVPRGFNVVVFPKFNKKDKMEIVEGEILKMYRAGAQT